MRGGRTTDPFVGYFDYVDHKLPTGRPQCSPKRRVPLYSADGTKDWFYGQPPCAPLPWVLRSLSCRPGA